MESRYGVWTIRREALCFLELKDKKVAAAAEEERRIGTGLEECARVLFVSEEECRE
jgi:hypothetical protein